MLEFILHMLILGDIGRVKAAHTGINQAELHELCDFVRILESPPTRPKDASGKEALDVPLKAVKILNEIAYLNASTTDDVTYKQIIAADTFESAQANPVVKDMTEKGWTELISLWKSKTEGKPNNRPVDPEVLALAHKKIGGVYEKAGKIVGQIDTIEEQVDKNLFEARKSMFAAVLGDNALASATYESKTSKDAFKNLAPDVKTLGNGQTSYTNICGNAGTGNEGNVGYSILSDAACICMKASSGTAEKFCGETAPWADVTKHQTAFSNGAEAGRTFTVAIRDECKKSPNTRSTVKPTPESLLSIVARHRAMLGANQVDTSGQPTTDGNLKFARFILGAYMNGKGAPTCNGNEGSTWSTASNGVCVNYAVYLANGKEIPWVTKILEAAEKLKENEAKYPHQLALLTQLENLKVTAEMLYEDAVHPLSNGGKFMATPDPQTTNASGNNRLPLSSADKETHTSGSSAKYENRFVMAAILLFLCH